jgi:hypothetical protein
MAGGMIGVRVGSRSLILGATTVEIAASHAVYLSQPDAVTALISAAAEATTSS